MLKTFLVGGFSLLIISAAAATTYYVNDSTGDDTNAGTTPGAAFKTISKAVSTFGNNDTISVAPGTYDQPAGTLSVVGKNNIVIQSSAGAASTTLTGNGLGGIIGLENLTNASVEGFTFTAGKPGVSLRRCHDVTIKNNIFRDTVSCYQAIDVANSEIAPITSSYVIIKNNTLEACWIYLNSLLTAEVAGNYFNGEDNGLSAFKIEMGASNILIEKNTMVRYTQGVSIRNFTTPVGPVTVRDNIFSHILHSVTAESGAMTDPAQLTVTYNDLWLNMRNAFSLDAASNNRVVRPRLVSVPGNDLRLYEGSPSLSSGHDSFNRGAYQGTGVSGWPGEKTIGYVNDASGVDSPDRGTAGAPWKTISYANEFPSSLINIGAGTYTTAEGETMLYLADNAHLSGEGAAQTIMAGSFPFTGAFQVCAVGSNITIEGLTLKDFYYYGIYAANQNTLVQNCILNGNTPLLDATKFAIVTNFGSNLTVKNTLIYDTSLALGAVNPGAAIEAFNLTINNCRSGSVLVSTAALPTLKVKNSLITNCTWGLTDECESRYNCYSGNTTNFTTGEIVSENDIFVDPLYVNTGSYDFHEKSQYGRWNNTAWVTDEVTSPCVDAGDPTDTAWQNETEPNGGRINIGAYGGTAYAAKSSTYGTTTTSTATTTTTAGETTTTATTSTSTTTAAGISLVTVDAGPAMISLSFKASSGGNTGRLLIIEPGPPPNPIIESLVPNVVSGDNQLSINTLAMTGKQLPSGTYKWKFVYQDRVYTGNFVVR